MRIAEHLDAGFGEDQRVGEDRAALDVEEIVTELPRRAEVRPGVAAAQGGPAGYPGLDQLTAGVVRKAALELGNDLRALGPRADQGHVTAKDVEQLRDLVEMGASQEPADAR